MFLKKTMLLLITIAAIISTTMAQTDKNYNKQWIKVEGFEKKGLTASALKEVLSIYNLAIKEKNDAQQIKSCMYQIKYRNIREEESQEKNIFFVDTLIAKAKTPAKNILQSMQAEMLWQYLQNHRWQFYNRTELKEEKSKDISTWSLEKLHAEITKRYKASLDVKTESILKATKLEGYDAIIIKGENTRTLRPTLYDFLAFRALDYFMTDERDITKPAYQFTINDPVAFAPAAQFAQHRFETKDTASLHYHALELLRDILIWHIADTKDDALLDADLIRLNFIYQYAVNDNKEKLYEAALKNIEEQFRNYEASAQAMYLRAKIYYDKGQDFDPFTKTDNQYEIKRAKELLEAAIKKYPKSEGGINAQNLVNSILQPSLSLETEKVNVPLQPFRTLVNYKNVPRVYFRLIKTNKEEIKKIDRRDYEKIWKDYVAMKPIKTWNIALPDPLDYQEHSTEIKVDALDNGTYFLLASIDENFALDKNIIAKQLTYVSNISYIHNNESDYYVLNRDNGQPLANSKVQVWESKYDYNKSQYTETKAEQYTTDKNGFFKLKKSKEYRTIQLQITNGSDELFMDENNNDYYGYNSYEEPKAAIQTFLFTDRSIYRPGQTVYFKGIVITKAGKAAESKVIPSFNSTLQLKDANGQKINELKLVTNEYGSYHGSFKLPEGSLNGQFSLHDEAGNGWHSFSVEEYKRPKFSVEVKKPEGTYRVNDSIKVTGIAKAYAGNKVDGAAVKYRVIRKVRYQPWFDYGFARRGNARKMMPYGRNEEVEITNGNIVTDSKGEFIITFKALPDESINKKDQPTFYYEVNADVTDLNGETRSGETSVAVAYQALQLNIDVPDKMNADSLHKLKVRSTNLNDVFEKTKVAISIDKLQEPGKIFRERYWDMSDQFVMSRDEYYSLFPYDVYKDEDKVNKWKVQKAIITVNDTTQEKDGIYLRLHKGTEEGKLLPGWYKIKVTTVDKYGEEVKAEKYIQLTGEKAITTDAVIVNIERATAEPGEKINYDIKTSFDNIWLIHTISKKENNTETNYPTVQNNNPYKNEIAVTENDRGGMAMSYAFVKHNRVYSGNENFDVPWSNKELNISYQTFRDKLLPGANEKWTVKISGNKGEKVAAEMLAEMYDASLDLFKGHNWNGINIWPRLFKNINWNKNVFNSISSENLNKKDYSPVLRANKSYDILYSLDIERLARMYGYIKQDKDGNEYVDWKKAATIKWSDKAAMGNIDMMILSPNNRIANAPVVAEALEGRVAGLDVTQGFYKKEDEMYVYGEQIKDTNIEDINSELEGKEQVQIRKNFNETAFFFPDLTTDAEGNVSFSAAVPEALTQWKLMTLAHTKDLKSGYSEKTLVTQKPLMVQPNAPRFMREGDKMEFSAKIVNLGDNAINGTAVLELLDAATNKPVDGLFKNISPTQNFSTTAGQSTVVKYAIEIPINFNSALTYRIVAKANDFSDGEEMSLPVLTNRTLVTESMPLNLRNTTNKDFKFEKLLNSGNSKTISNHALTVEYTSNPAWYAVQALPYLMEYPYECAEQTFNRYYANTLASHITNSIPKIKAVFNSWATKVLLTGEDLGGALLSNLQKNEELKSALLQETPWVMDAQNEAQQKKNIALLFDMVKMSNETDKAISKLKEMQGSNGGFVWFKGGPDDRYITQYIITGIGHLKKLNALSGNTGQQMNDINSIVKKAIPYLDKKIKEEYDWLIKSKTKLSQNNLSYTAIQYLYMRSFFTETTVAAPSQTAFNYYKQQSQKYWLSNGKYMQAMIALSLQRNGDGKTAKAITKSLKENAINNEELGMYWKEWTNRGWFWHQAPIESQALMIEAFTEIDKSQTTVDDLKTWLLKQKQTQNWGTTKATAEACYALLLNGSDWLKEEKEVTINLGSRIIKSDNEEAGSGYFKEKIEGKDVKADMGNISVSINNSTSKPLNSSMSWGSVYWQYFEDLDKITSAETPLKLVKKLFVERNTDKGPVLDALQDGAQLKVGDKVKVRIELRVDRDMEYVHMKDMRAACMEPVNVLSGYKYQDALGYYESTKDASTNFFFSWLNKGTYVFEYPMFVTHEGNFSNGITTIQCMYAPEFTSHSEGVRVSVTQ
jgi:uncharacterized protein YfaS (alpha-2-macroglobulin family)